MDFLTWKHANQPTCSLKENLLDIENVRSYYPTCSPVFVQQLSSGGSSGDGETVSADQVLDKIKTKVQLQLNLPI